jgi:N-acetyl-1-D-myo-inositol-2-amino-2-deoxy-alpha-D-glucopyranoside deacetylase
MIILWERRTELSPLRLLACFAHPDDEAFSASGILASSTARGVEVRLICATRGEAGDIRAPGSATRETLGKVRHAELRCSCTVLGVDEPIVLGYRDSGWADDPAQHHPDAFVNAAADDIVGRLVREIRQFRPHVVLTFEPGGLSGHKDHMAISDHTTMAFAAAGDPEAYPVFLGNGATPYRPARLFYNARPRGFRMHRALRLRQAGLEVPLPDPDRRHQGVPPEEIHISLDVTAYLEQKLASIRCHHTQVGPNWPLHQVSADVLRDLLGREYLIQASPSVPPGVRLSGDLFAGIETD